MPLLFEIEEEQTVSTPQIEVMKPIELIKKQ